MRRSVIIALVIAALTALWILSGVLGIGKPAKDMAAGPDTATERVLTKVRVSDVEAEERIDSVSVNGRSEARRIVDLRAEIEAPVEETPVEEGSRVDKGDLIVRLAVQDRRSLLREARATLEQREIEFNAAKELAGKGFNSQIRLAQARSELERARAALDRAETDLTQTEIRAPIAGILDQRLVEIGNLVRPGDEVARLVDLSVIKVVGFVTERQVTHIAAGAEAEITFLEGPTRRGSVTFVAASADPQTRTFRVEATIPNPDGALIDGLTARMNIPLDAQRAHKVPLSALTLDDEGNVGVKAVDGNNRVTFLPVEILSDTPDGVWLAGLPEKFTLITVGQEFVTPGQQVEPVYQPPPGRSAAQISAEGPS